MAQHDYNIANGGGAAVRGDINDALQAIITQNSGPTEPTLTRSFMPWYDTTNGELKIRNASNTAWDTYANFVISVLGFTPANADATVNLTGDQGVQGQKLFSHIASTVTAVAALDINCVSGNFFTKTINGNSTFTFSNVPAARAYGFTLELTHTSGSVTWPASVTWPNNITPSLTTGKTHLFIFVTDDGGSRWRAAALTDFTN